MNVTDQAKFNKFVELYHYTAMQKGFEGHDANGHTVQMTHFHRVIPYGPTVFAGWCPECEAPWLIEDSGEDGTTYEFGDMSEIEIFEEDLVEADPDNHINLP